MNKIEGFFRFSYRFLFQSLFLCAILNLFSTCFLYSDIEQKEKADQTIWQWNSPFGSYPIYYVEKGTGSRHILLIHGFAAHSFTWRFIIDNLAQAGYHVWSMDLIGSGLSTKPSDIPYGLRLFINQIEAFMEAKKIHSASLIGNSGGFCHF